MKKLSENPVSLPLSQLLHRDKHIYHLLIWTIINSMFLGWLYPSISHLSSSSMSDQFYPTFFILFPKQDIEYKRMMIKGGIFCNLTWWNFQNELNGKSRCIEAQLWLFLKIKSLSQNLTTWKLLLRWKLPTKKEKYLFPYIMEQRNQKKKNKRRKIKKKWKSHSKKSLFSKKLIDW